MTNINTMPAIAATPKALKGRPDVKQGCNPCDKTQAIAANRPANLMWVVNNCKSIVYKTSNSLKTKTKRAFALLLMLALLAPVAARAQAQTYNINLTVNSPEGGTASILVKKPNSFNWQPAEQAEAGDQVTARVTPNAGYGIASVTAVTQSGQGLSLSEWATGSSAIDYIFTMPEEPVDVTVNFSGTYPITLTQTGNHPSASVSVPSSGIEGEEITGVLLLSGIYDAFLKSVSVTGADGTDIPVTINGNSFVFTMPPQAVEVEAEIGAVASKLASITADGGTLEPAFDPDVTAYTITVPYETEEIGLASEHPKRLIIIENEWKPGSLQLTYDPNHSDRLIRVEGTIALDLGDNVVHLTASNVNGYFEETEYTVTITRLIPFSIGSGTETDPFIIATTDDMDQLAADVNGGTTYSGTHFLMTADLDYSGKDYTPVGNWNNQFCGHFNGGGHTITNITLSGNGYYYAIFGVIGNGGMVENLTLDQSSIGDYGYYLGGIAGSVYYGTIRNCVNKASLILEDYTHEGNYYGGIAGDAENSSIIDCQNRGNVRGGSFTGGIVGRSNNTIITGCQNFGRVEHPSGVFSYRGGIVGTVYNSTVNHCVNAASAYVSGHYYVGGIVGEAESSSVSNCLHLGIMSYVNDCQGGIVGMNSGANNTYSNNYYRDPYAGNIGGIQGNDVEGQAMYGYAVSGEDGITVGVAGSIGLAYEGTSYAGNGESVALNISAPVGYIPSNGYSASAGTLTPSGDAYTLAMPEEDVTITATLVAVKSFASEGSWCEASNWVPEGVPTLEDDIYLFANATVPEGCVAEANSVTAVGGSNLTIEDGGQLKSNSDVNATIKKHITGYGESTDGGWYLVGFPTSVFPGPEPTALGLITTESDFDFYFFANNFPDGLEWRNYKAGAITRIQAMLRYGYLYANASDMDIVLSNSLNASADDDVISLIYSGNYDFKGWHLHGNPFPCDAYVYDNATGAYRSLYRMNTDGDGLIPATGVVHPMEGFFTQATTTGEKIRISRNPIVAQSNLLSIDLVEGNANTNRDGSTPAATDRAIIRFGEGNTLEKFSLSDRTSKIYIPHGGKDYAVATVGRDAPWHVSTTDEIPINFKAAKNGTYTLTFDTQNLDLEYLHLIDNLTGADIDLIPLLRGQGGLNDTRPSTASYTFTAKTTDYASRFRLVFSEPADETSANRPFAYIADGEIRINEADARDASLQVVDVMGRVIVTKDVARNVSTNGMTPGVYVLRLIDGDNVKTQKIVVE